MKILETPRDAMQGLAGIISTDKKVEMINALLKVGFDIVDVGSFVSEKAVPQMADTQEVIKQIDITSTRSKLFVLVVNLSGANRAADIKKIDYIGFPFSTSETFLKKNINATIDHGWQLVERIQEICVQSNKRFMVYLSMAFGNPYGDPVSVEIIHQYVDRLNTMGIKNISMSDIIGETSPELIEQTYSLLTKKYPHIDFGIHLHIKNNDWHDKIEMAFHNGCKIFEGVINGFGGCPMTGYEMVGNLPTANIIDFAKEKNITLKIDDENFFKAKSLANKILTN